jgi:hypothetical protein
MTCIATGFGQVSEVTAQANIRFAAMLYRRPRTNESRSAVRLSILDGKIRFYVSGAVRIPELWLHCLIRYPG